LAEKPNTEVYRHLINEVFPGCSDGFRLIMRVLRNGFLNHLRG